MWGFILGSLVFVAPHTGIILQVIRLKQLRADLGCVFFAVAAVSGLWFRASGFRFSCLGALGSGTAPP